MKMTDEQLMEGLRRGNMMAFGELYRSHRDPLVRFARLQVGEGPAEDIVQEVFMNLWTQRNHLQTLESPRSYLLRAVHNRALNYLRDESHRSDFRNQYQRNIEIMAASRSNPDRNEVIRSLYAKETLSSIEEALELLPGRCREIFRMSYIEGYSHKEIAEKLSLSLSTVDNQVYKALKILRKHLSEEMIAILLLFFL